MDRLDEEKAMVREMVSNGMSFADIARKIGVDYMWVYKRCDNLYAKTGAKEKKKDLSENEKLQIKIDNIKKERSRIKEERSKIDEDLNYSPHRTLEELIEYRKKRDKDPGAPGALPRFD
jgi:transposase-like protein